jgi:hypothetical protein
MTTTTTTQTTSRKNANTAASGRYNIPQWNKQWNSKNTVEAKAATTKSAIAVMDLPPAIQSIDSDQSWSTDDSAPFPLPLEQLYKYPAEQRKQQVKANRFFNFFERYALEVSEAGGGLCGGAVNECGGGIANKGTDGNQAMRNTSIFVFDDSSVNGEETSDAANGTATDGTGAGTDTTAPKKKVRWNLSGVSCNAVKSVSCNAVNYGDFYDRYMLVVSEVGASCNSTGEGKETATSNIVTGEGGGDQAAGARSLRVNKKDSPTSTIQTDQVDNSNSSRKNSNKAQVESNEDSEEDDFNPNQVDCTSMEGVAKALPFNLNKFWEALMKNNGDEEDDFDEEDDRPKGNPKRTAARKSSSSTLSTKEVRYVIFVSTTARWIIHYRISFESKESLTYPSVHFYLFIIYS